VGEVVAPPERKAGADQRVGHPRPLRDAQALVVEEGAAPLRREEEVVSRRVVDDRLLDLVAKGEADRDRVRRQAVDEIGRAVERVDDPDVLAVARAARAARLLGEDAVARVGREQDVDDRRLGGVIDLGDEVVRAPSSSPAAARGRATPG
jgi:hypothetical protein